jgi:uncharacterized membrane protein YeaQ/YmgE (transglycosylase-associated protein family)
MLFLSWLVMGVFAGWLAGRVLRAGEYGMVGDVFIGILGGCFGGWFAQSVMKITAGMNVISIQSTLVAFLGAVIFLVVMRVVASGRRSILR